MTIFFFILIEVLVFDVEASLDTAEYVDALLPFVVSKVYKRECCLEDRTLAYMPVRSTNVGTEYERISSWDHNSKQDNNGRKYKLDCYKKKQTDKDNNKQEFFARIFCNPEVILLELQVSNCEKIQEFVKIEDIFENPQDRLHYHNIKVNNVRFPREDSSELRRTAEKTDYTSSAEESKRKTKGEQRDYLNCVYFVIHEKRDQEKNCEEDLVIDPKEWKNPTEE